MNSNTPISDALPAATDPSAVQVAAEYVVEGLLMARAAQQNGALEQGIQRLRRRIDDRFAVLDSTHSLVVDSAQGAPLQQSSQQPAAELDLQWRLLAQAVSDGEADQAGLATWQDQCARRPEAARFAQQLQQYKRWSTRRGPGPHSSESVASAAMEDVLARLQPLARPNQSWSIPAWTVLALVVVISLLAVAGLSVAGSLHLAHIVILGSHIALLATLMLALAWISLRSMCVESRDILSRLLTWRLRPVPCVTMCAMAVAMPAGLLLVGW